MCFKPRGFKNTAVPPGIPNPLNHSPAFPPRTHREGRGCRFGRAGTRGDTRGQPGWGVPASRRSQTHAGPTQNPRKPPQIRPEAPGPAAPVPAAGPPHPGPASSSRGPGKLIPVTPLRFQVTAGAGPASLCPGAAPIPGSSPREGKRASRLLKALARGQELLKNLQDERSSFTRVSLRC